MQNRPATSSTASISRTVTLLVRFQVSPPNSIHNRRLTPRSSIIPPAREDGQVKRGPGGPQGEFRTPQETARYRLTIRRVRRWLSDSDSTIWGPVFSTFIPDDFGRKAGAGSNEGQATLRWPHAKQHAASHAKAASDRAGDRLTMATIVISLISSVQYGRIQILSRLAGGFGHPSPLNYGLLSRSLFCHD